jgi:hypothetical protein
VGTWVLHLAVYKTMALKIFGKQAKQPPAEAPLHTYLCLMFVNQSVQAALWKIEGSDIQTLSQSSLLAFEDDEDGLLKADQALQELEQDSEHISEVVFGFDPQWVDKVGLLAHRKSFIKSLTENLGLTPVGFVVVTDALIQHILSKNAMASEVLIYTHHDTVSIFLLKQGKLIHELAVGRSENIIQDIVEGLARFTNELTGKDAYLPAKLVLASPVLSAQEMDDAQQKIMSYNWSENHPFVQKPVVETMVALDVLQAVVEQAGSAVAEAKGLKGRSATAAPVAADAEEFGFENIDSPVEGGDNFASADGAQATSFGVPIGMEKLPEPQSRTMGASSRTVGPKRKWQLPNFLQKLKHWYQNHPHKNVILGGVGGGVLALLAIFIGWTALAYRVEISVELTEQVITKDVEITIDPTVASSRPEQQILKGSLEELEVTGSETIDTTGVTLVGERASGEVTIFNKTTAPKTFTAGTSLTTGSVGFTLDDEVTVASASSEESGGQAVTTFGQTDVGVTASAIGAEGNIGEGTELTIDSFSLSTYAAQAKGGFAGGSSREVRVVAPEDRTQALEVLETKLVTQASQMFSEKSGDGLFYAPTSRTSVEEANYSAAAGDETDRLTLDLTLQVTGVSYRAEDLRPLWEAALADDIPEGYQLIDDDPEFLSDIRPAATASARVILDASVRAKARPPFDQPAVVESILGLPLRELLVSLTERPEIENADYQLKPGVARFLVRKVPTNLERVTIMVTNQAE